MTADVERSLDVSPAKAGRFAVVGIPEGLRSILRQPVVAESVNA
jgi:hypothetical protein